MPSPSTSPHPASSAEPLPTARPSPAEVHANLVPLRTCLRDLSSTLRQEQALLERLWYKSRAQFRSAKWFKECDAVRAGLKRLLGPVKEDGKGKAKAKERGTSREVSRGKGSGVEQREKKPVRAGSKAMNYSKDCLMAEVMLVVDETIRQTKPSPRTATPSPSPPALQEDDATQSSSRSSCPEDAITMETGRAYLDSAFALLRLYYLLVDLSNRARKAFLFLEAHLRTPPAPTFAPLALVLLALCAKVERSCHAALAGRASHGKQSEGPHSDRAQGTGSGGTTMSKSEVAATAITGVYAVTRVAAGCPLSPDGQPRWSACAIWTAPTSMDRLPQELQQEVNKRRRKLFMRTRTIDCDTHERWLVLLPRQLADLERPTTAKQRRSGGDQNSNGRKRQRDEAETVLEKDAESVQDSQPAKRKRKSLMEQMLEDEGLSVADLA
ncbi:unnamed protein product [Jaminaea pallidilutea]